MPNVFHIVINPKSLEYYKDIKKYVLGLKYFQYMRCVEHIGQEEKHYHLVLQLSRSMPKLSVTKLHGAHIKPKTFGSTKALIDYINCEDEEHKKNNVTYELVDEIGKYKPQGGDHTVKTLLEYDNVEDLPDYKMVNTWKRLKLEKESTNSFRNMLSEIKNGLLTGPNVIYFIGKPGSGKTYNAYKYALSKYNEDEITRVSIINNFFKFTGSDKDKCLIIEEFRPSQLHPSLLLQFTDKYGFECPIKGSYKYVRPECIIICSIIHPARLYREEKEELNEQFTRRITHLYEVEYDHNYKEIDINNKTIENMYIYNCEFK